MHFVILMGKFFKKFLWTQNAKIPFKIAFIINYAFENRFLHLLKKSFCFPVTWDSNIQRIFIIFSRISHIAFLQKIYKIGVNSYEIRDYDDKTEEKALSLRTKKVYGIYHKFLRRI